MPRWLPFEAKATLHHDAARENGRQTGALPIRRRYYRV